MTRIIPIYGALSGSVIIAALTLGIVLAGGHAHIPVWAGYLIMLAALSLIFAGIKRYRDTERGGVITFLQGFGVGMGIAAVASVFYVLGWEVYMWATHYTFMDTYTKGVIEAKKAAGASPADLARLKAQMAAMAVQYKDPLYRMGMTLVEILPVAAAVALISAVVLRFRSVLPARGA